MQQAYEMARGDPSWRREETGMTPPQTHLAQMTGLLGPFPPSLLERGTRFSRYIDDFVIDPDQRWSAARLLE